MNRLLGIVGVASLLVMGSVAAVSAADSGFYVNCGGKMPLTSDDKWSGYGMGCGGGMHVDPDMSVWLDFDQQRGEIAGTETKTYAGALGGAFHLPVADGFDFVPRIGLGLYKTKYDNKSGDTSGAVLRSGLDLAVDIGSFREHQPYFRVGVGADWYVAGSNIGKEYGVTGNAGLGIRF